MRKLPFLVLTILVVGSMLFSTYGCVDKKNQTADSLSADSMAEDTMAEDTLSTLISQTPLSKAADELFDDFFFNFAANKKLQFKRIKFPLPVYKDGKVEKQITKDQWKMDYFFMRQGYYTLIFDNLKQMAVVKDTSIHQVTVEKILLKNNIVKQFKFDKLQGEWTLTSIAFISVHSTANGSFLHFYQRFSTDSVFQIKSMNDKVVFTAPDPDDDFNTITGTIIPEQWPGFKPPFIPKGLIYNILYGQKYVAGKQKVFVVRGIANDLEIEMVFQLKKNGWKLMKFNS